MPSYFVRAESSLSSYPCARSQALGVLRGWRESPGGAGGPRLRTAERTASARYGTPSHRPPPPHSRRQVRQSPECELSAAVPLAAVSRREASMMYQKSVAMATTRKTKLEAPTRATSSDRTLRLTLMLPAGPREEMHADGKGGAGGGDAGAARCRHGGSRWRRRAGSSAAPGRSARALHREPRSVACLLRTHPRLPRGMLSNAQSLHSHSLFFSGMGTGHGVWHPDPLVATSSQVRFSSRMNSKENIPGEGVFTHSHQHHSCLCFAVQVQTRMCTAAIYNSLSIQEYALKWLQLYFELLPSYLSQVYL